MGIIQTVVQDNQFRPEDIPAFEQKLFFEGDKRRLSLEKFAILLFLSTIIATYGVLGDSTATVIGAMIIAPLMTPIMATAAGVAMGRLDRAGRALLTVAAGVAGVIALSWLLATLFPGVISPTGNAQIAARISPRLLDLLVALASGLAGAFAMSREDVADSLPGVAISISLVPPLCVVGTGLAINNPDVALGAFLLFITNFFSILLAGSALFSTLGLSRAAMVQIKGKGAAPRLCPDPAWHFSHRHPAQHNQLSRLAGFLDAVPRCQSDRRVGNERKFRYSGYWYSGGCVVYSGGWRTTPHLVSRTGNESGTGGATAVNRQSASHPGL